MVKRPDTYGLMWATPEPVIPVPFRTISNLRPDVDPRVILLILLFGELICYYLGLEFLKDFMVGLVDCNLIRRLGEAGNPETLIPYGMNFDCFYLDAFSKPLSRELLLFECSPGLRTSATGVC